MAKPYSDDLRERVVGAVEGGSSRREAAGQFDVSVSFVVKLMQRDQATGSFRPGDFGGRKKRSSLGARPWCVSSSSKRRARRSSNCRRS